MLAAEPLYVLVDTAVVGHLGRVPLAALALGGAVLSVAAWLGTVLAYGTTGRAARRFGAGDRAARRRARACRRPGWRSAAGVAAWRCWRSSSPAR